MRATALLVVLLAGCASQLSQAAQHPGSIECGGKVSASIVGGIGPTAGVNGSVTADCQPNSYIRWGGQ